MPRKKTKELLEDISPTQSESETRPESQDKPQELQITAQELAQSISEPEPDQPQSPGETSAKLLTEAHPKDFLGASVEVAIASMGTLFESQAQLAGTELADKVFDQLEEAFVNRLEERLQPFIDVVLPQIQETSRELKQSSTARLERRQGAFDRLKQISSLITDECRLLPPVVAVGEFVSWEPVQVIEPKETD